MQYQNYIFDLYGTLVDIHTDEECAQVWEKLRLFYGYYGAVYAPGELKEAYEHLVRVCDCQKGDCFGVHYSHEAYPEIQIEQVFRELFANKGVAADDALAIHAGQFFRVLTTEYVRLYEGVSEMLEKLRKKGKKIYLLSNAQRIFTEYEMRMLDIEKYLDWIMISSDYGVKKPDLRFFEALQERYHLDPKESIMIGNDADADAAGAKRAKMAAYYVHSSLSPEVTAEIEADYVQMEMDIERMCRNII